MRKTLRQSLVVGGIAVLGFGIWFFRSGTSTSHAQAAAKPEAIVPGQAPSEEQRKRLLAQVEKVVAMRNREERKQREAFEADGWEVTQGNPPPDKQLLAYDPSLLKSGREMELRYQISSTTGHPEDAKNLAQIAIEAKELETRWHAVEALYRIAGDAGQPELYDLLKDGKMAKDDPARSQIAPRLLPPNLEGDYAANLARLLDSPNLLPVEKVQIATTLAILSLRDGTMLDARVIASLSPGAQQLIARQIEFVKNELPSAWTGGHGTEHEGH